MTMLHSPSLKSILLLVGVVCFSLAHAWTATTSASYIRRPSLTVAASPNNLFDDIARILGNIPGTKINSASTGRLCKARELIKELVEVEKCFATIDGAVAFGEACATNIVYEDCFEPQPFVGRASVTDHIKAKVEARKGKGDVRIDRISDGTRSCGFAWTWVAGNEEGLRGTTFVELNDDGEIQYVREIPEPLYKPGDLTLELLKAVTSGAEVTPPAIFERKTPTTACDVAKYLFLDVQGGDIDESLRLFDESIVYRDFNYEEPLKGKAEVRKFIEDFSFPGITFRPERFCDGIDSTCFTWDVCLDGVEDTVKGISFYELDKETRLISYVRDVPESAIKPAPLGKIARTLRPGLGVFKGVPVGSRPGGK
jgi:SnoaL-like domain